MTEQKDEKENKEEKKVRIYHTGKGYGPMDTASGKLMPNHSLEVAESVGKKLTGAYAHVKYAADVIPEDKAKAAAAAKEKADLQGKVKDLESKLAEANKASGEGGAAATKALQEFLKAGSKKDLEALQEKYKDLLAKEPAA